MPRWSGVYVPWVPQRLVMCSLAACGTMVGWMMYYSGYNIIEEFMVRDLHHPGLTHRISGNSQCLPPTINDTEDDMLEVVHRWYPSASLLQLLAFWAPFSVSCVVSGLAADMVGPRQVWAIGGLVAAVSVALVDPMAKITTYAGLACISVCGLGAGVLSPCSSVLVAYWVPENERTFSVAFIESTMFLGLMIDFVLHSQITTSDGPWDRWLYLSCAAGSVWVLAWYTLFYNHPTDHPHMSPRELQYLKARTTSARGGRKQIPWKDILLSPPFVSLVLLTIAATWVESILGYQMIVYLSQVLNETSILVRGVDATGMTYGAGFTSILVHGWISDKLISTGITSRTANRRIFLLSSNYVSAVLLLTIPSLQRNTTLVVVVFFLAIQMQGVGYAVMLSNVVDLSPRHAGLLRGVQTGIRAMASVFCRRLVKFMVTVPSNYSSWSSVFYISAAIVIILSSPYLCFGSGEIQAWKKAVQDDEQERTTQNPTTSQPLSEQTTL